jgi:Uma2 family endonuclease
MIMTAHITEPQNRHWSLAEYYQLAEQGWFEGQRVQLIEGEIIQMPPQGHAHYKSLALVSRWLEKALGPGYWVRTQAPMNASDTSDPEPDIAVVRGSIEQFQDHPQTALLAIEVADSSLRLDRRKAGIYAAAGVQEYWIVNLNNRCIEIHRDPHAEESSSRFGYHTSTIAYENDHISPLIAPGAQVKVSELLP